MKSDLKISQTDHRLGNQLEKLLLTTINFILIEGGRILPVNRRQAIFPNGTLTIENVQRSLDQGTYTCVAKNKQRFSAKGNLEVQVMGKLIAFQSSLSIPAIQSSIYR